MAEIISLENASQSQSLLPTPSRTYRLDKFTSPNYLVWRVRMELLLQRAQLWDVVIEGAKNAPPTTDAEGLACWQQKDLAAQMKIIVHLGDHQVQLVRALSTSNAVWKLLRSSYEHTDLITQVTLLKRLVNSTMNEGQSATQFIDEWQKILDDGAIASLAIPENLQSMLLLAVLPPSWRAFITTQSSSTTDLQLQGLISKIIQEDNLHQHGDSSTKPLAMVTSIKANSHRHQRKFGKSILPSPSYSTSPHRSFPQKQNSNFQKKSPPYNSSYTCTFCNRTGHLKRDCRTKRRTLSFNTTKPQAHLTTLEHPYTNEETTLCLFATSLNTSTSNDVWLFDTGATHHMTFYQPWLHNFTPLANPLPFYLGDNSMQHAIGYGDINITLPGGQITTISKGTMKIEEGKDEQHYESGVALETEGMKVQVKLKKRDADIAAQGIDSSFGEVDTEQAEPPTLLGKSLGAFDCQAASMLAGM
ncbi:hypothetical protein L7F22_013665 [Adiantum nelumboides]|nr:hypothetical protein [Adiantum nelumboides]